MGVKKATFQSAGEISQHLIPGGYSRVDAVKGAAGFASTSNGVIIGQCTGGEPATLLQFNTLGDAIRTLKSGPLMDAMRFAFNPGGGYVPQRLFAMRMNDADQSHIHLVKGANSMIQLTSIDYGLDMNQLRSKVETGTNYGKKLTVQYKTVTETFDDIRKQSFTILHSSACTMTITNTSAAHTLAISVGSVTIDLTSYPTVGALVAYLNTIANVTAAVIAGQEDASTLELDGTAAADVHTGTYTAESTMQAIIDTVNDYSGLITAEADNATNNRGIPDNVALAYFGGGAEGSYTSSEWAAALTVLEAEDIQMVSCPDTDASLHALIKTHCEAMSAVTGKKERQFIVGGAWSAAVATATAASAVLNSKPGMYVYNGFTQYDVNGVLQDYSAGYMACMLLGLACTVAINQPLTTKAVNVVSLEKKISNSDLEKLIAGGVCAIAYNAKGVPSVVRSVTTYQGEELQWNEFSMVREMYFVSRDLREYLEGLYVGQPGSIGMASIAGAVDNRLRDYVDLGVIMVGETGVAFWAISVTMTGDVVSIDFDAYVTAPINFLFVTNHFHTVANLAA